MGLVVGYGCSKEEKQVTLFDLAQISERDITLVWIHDAHKNPARGSPWQARGKPILRVPTSKKMGDYLVHLVVVILQSRPWRIT